MEAFRQAVQIIQSLQRREADFERYYQGFFASSSRS